MQSQPTDCPPLGRRLTLAPLTVALGGFNLVCLPGYFVVLLLGGISVPGKRDDVPAAIY